MSTRKDRESKWTFFSNHGHVYFTIAIHGATVIREIARLVGITERSVQGIIQDLEADGYIKKEKLGRENRYKIVQKKTLRHPLEKNVEVAELVRVLDRYLGPKEVQD